MDDNDGGSPGTPTTRWLLGLPVAKRLMVVLSVYLVLCAALIGVRVYAGRSLASARDAISREVNAVELLVRHVRTREEQDWQAYVEALAGALPGERSRTERTRSVADRAAAYAVVASARPAPWVLTLPHPLLDHAGLGSAVDELARVWREAHQTLGGLEAAAAGLHQELTARRPSPVRIERLTADVARLTTQIRDADTRIAEHLETVSDAVGRAVEQALLALTFVSLVIALWIALRSAARLQRTLADLRVRVAQVSRGDFSGRVDFDTTDGLDALAGAFNEMTRRLTEAREHARDNSHELGKTVRELENILETIPDVICIVDLLGRLDLWNRNLETVTGLSTSALKKKSVADLFVDVDRERIDEVIREGIRKGHFEVEAELRRGDGSRASYHWSGAVLEDEQGRVRGLTLSGRDITERKGLEDQLARQAFEDALTGLPNRALFMDRLAHALSRRDRHDRQVAVLFLDLNRFKTINDSLGHSLGDQLLVDVSRRLETCVRPEDTIARLGGDEFGILLEDVESTAAPAGVADRIAAQLEAPFVLEGREVFVSTSIGIALSPLRRCRPEEVLRDADLAMYHAKGRGSPFEIFDGSVSAPSLERLDLELDLRSAIARQEFRVFYQPLVSLDSGRISEVEALVRWQHPRRGLLTPAEFIALSEETGLIVPIGLWVLGEACRHARQWQVEHRRAVPVTVSVNLSARQFQQPDLVQQIARTLADTGLQPAALNIEITESVIMHDAPSTLAKLRALKELGVRLAIDDFGTGYSSLSYLKRFPVDTLKIDRSFVQGIGHDPEDMAIVRAVVTVAKSLNLGVTAEGIDASHQVALLQTLGCDRGQGYFFAGPMEPDALGDLLSRSAWLGPMGDPGLLGSPAVPASADVAAATPA